MVICAIVQCNNRSEKKVDKISFFSIPSIISHQGEKALALSVERRALWLARIQRADLADKDVKAHTRVCSVHFIQGKI